MNEPLRLVAPLVWPAAIPRRTDRREGLFKTGGHYLTPAEAVARLGRELDLWGASNAELAASWGLTRSGNVSTQVPAKGDPACVLIFDAPMKVGGVAGVSRTFTLPVDTYTELAQNVGALAAHLEAVRATERYGVATLAQSMGAFLALPASTGWREILRHPATLADANAVYRELAAILHPDNRDTGDERRMAELSAAIADARAHFENAP